MNTLNSTFTPYRFSRKDNVCVATFAQLVRLGGFLGNDSLGNASRCLRDAMKHDGLGIIKTDEPPPRSPFSMIPPRVWKKIVDWTNSDDPNDDFDEIFFSRLLQDENVPPETRRKVGGAMKNPPEEILGLYDPTCNRIILFSTTIKLWARRKHIKDTVFTPVVLIHELGHWFHKFAVGNSPVSTFSNSSTDLLECIAQWFSACLFSFVKYMPSKYGFGPSGASGAFIREYNDAFSKLNATQSSPYQTFHQFEKCLPWHFLSALRSLRQLDGKTDLPFFQAKLLQATT